MTRPLFRSFGHHINRHIFAAELAIMETHATVRGSEQRVVFTHANIHARIYAGAALTNDDVTTDDFLATEFLYAKATAC